MCYHSIFQRGSNFSYQNSHSKTDEKSAEMELELKEQREKLLEERDFVDDSLNEMDLDSYTTKKTLAEGLLDMTILTRNVTLLRELIRKGRDKSMFYDLLMVIIPLALTLQVSPDTNQKNSLF